MKVLGELQKASKVTDSVKQTSEVKGTMQVIKEWWYGYDEKLLAQIRAIREAYSSVFFSSKTEVKGDAQANIPSSAEENYPEYFQMNDKFNLPVKFSQYHSNKISIIREGHLLTEKMGEGHLRTVAEDMLKYICFFQQKRVEQIVGDGKDYDPTNLFCEEFKSWLIELSNAPLNQKTLDRLVARLTYLTKLGISRDFLYEKWTIVQTFSKEQLIIYLKKGLESKLVPLVKIGIARESAKDHFDNLKKSLHSSIRQLFEFLFYIYRDTNSFPKNLSMDEFRKYDTPHAEYIKSQKTLSGELLVLVSLTPSFVETFDKSGVDVLDLKDANEVLLLDKSGQIMLPHQKIDSAKLWRKKHKLENWFLDNDSGIAKGFQNLETMKLFVLGHVFIEQLCRFDNICQTIYDLSGEGGNILVYGYAAKQVKNVLQNCQVLLQNLDTCRGKMLQIASDFYEKLCRQGVQNDKEYANWIACYGITQSANAQLTTNIGSCIELTSKVLTCIDNFSMEEQLNWVKAKLNQLQAQTNSCLLVNAFIDRQFNGMISDNNNKSDRARLSSTTLFNSSIITSTAELERLKIQELYESACKNFQQTIAAAKLTMADLNKILPPVGVGYNLASNNGDKNIITSAYYLRAKLSMISNNKKNAIIDLNCLLGVDPEHASAQQFLDQLNGIMSNSKDLHV